MDGEGPFISSDNPIGLFEAPPTDSYLCPSFTSRNTVVTFPLNKRVALVGEFDRQPHVADVRKPVVAIINLQAMGRAYRFVYSPSGDFPCLQPDGSVGGVRGVLPFP